MWWWDSVGEPECPQCLGWHCRNGDGVGFPAWCVWGLSSCPKLGLISLHLLLFFRAEHSFVPVCWWDKVPSALVPCLISHSGWDLCSFLKRERGNTPRLLAMRPKSTSRRVVRLAEDSLYLVISQMLTFVLRQMLRAADKYAAREVI